MRIYSIEECLSKISHYEAIASYQDKPQRWRELAALSIATWKWQLERAMGVE